MFSVNRFIKYNLIIFLAVVVGTIVIAMFLPMIKIISSVSGGGAG